MTGHFKATLLAASAVLGLPSCATSPEQQATQQVIQLREQKIERERAGPTMTAYDDGVHDDSKQRELGIRSLEVAVNVRGAIAETIVTVAFENATSDELEGQFVLNMARGAVVTGYALDINGVMVDGVLETRYKAAEAYQRRVNRRIDPGVAEVDYSDRFETRIYPIPAEGSRTVRLRMVSPFDPDGGYSLPLTVADKVKHFKLTLDGEARIVSVPEGLAAAKTVEAEQVSLKGALRLAAPERTTPMLVSRHPGAERFFDIVGEAPRAAPESRHPLHIFWDRSVSRTDDALKEEAQLAEDFALVRGLRRVDVTLFDSGKVETIDVGADRLSETLNDVRYRGGTSFAQLAPVAVAKDADCLMFSDGRVSIDDRTDFTLPCDVTSITSGPESDAAWLGDLAERTGGAFHTLTESNSEAVLKQLVRPDAAIRSITDGAGKPIDAVRLASDSRSFHLVGPYPADGIVLVNLEGEAKPRYFSASDARTPTFAGPGALWARHRLGVAATEWKPDDLAAMARRYNVATPQASFVVLEAPSDYVEAKITPPANYPKALRAEYTELQLEFLADEASERRGRLTDVVEMWEQQKAWWAHKFDGKVPASKDKRAEAGSPPPPAAMAAPRPAPTQAEAGAPAAIEFAQSLTIARDAADATNFAPGLSYSRGGAGGDEETGERVVVTGSRIVSDDNAEAEQGRAGSIELADWNADRPYLDRLDKAGADWERAIDREMPESAFSPLFWFDLAEWHWRAGRKEEARRAAEAALDMPTRDNQTLAIVAARLVRYGSFDRGIWLLERLMERETDRPQPMRTLALALVERAKFTKTQDAAKADLSRAVDLLAKAATSLYDQSAEGIETVALMEANATLAKLKAMGGSSTALDPRLIALLDADVRVVMEWNTPRTDIDLWVTEPKGAKVGYSSPMSPWGGKLSGDITDGYGPEEYVIHKANSGKYVVRAKTFASDRANPNGPSTLTVRLIRNFGRPSQSEELIDIEMPAEEREELDVGVFTIE